MLENDKSIVVMRGIGQTIDPISYDHCTLSEETVSAIYNIFLSALSGVLKLSPMECYFRQVSQTHL